ncbi:MAG: GH3 auxin-responsive promoter family protein [Duncaniella sp.]|nr:GH3 auxin-responsive promoter family protein [Duncaniella sp.]
MNFTPLARPWFIHKSERTLSWRGRVEEVQRRQLDLLLERGCRTKWGAARGLDPRGGYDGFRRALPQPQAYPEIREWVMRMIGGEPDVLWPGVTRRYAQSSGTTDGKSKYIPITDDSLRINHYEGGAQVVAHYLHLYPDSRLFSGKGFILGGSYANELPPSPGVKVGDLSATLIDCINPLVNLARVPSKRIALMADWQQKLPALIEASLHQDITNISGVPSWFLTVLKGVMQRAGVECIHDVWPNLEVFFHGGISMLPYRAQYARITRPSMRYLESYNASEGFFAVQDTLDAPGMLLLLDCGVFYEFIPLSQLHTDRPEPLPAWQVEEGQVYSLVITACNGLWRYTPGDTVRVESVDPLRITIAGRTKSYINAFGEELMVGNAEAAMTRVCRDMGCSVVNYTAAPVYASDSTRGRHEWVVEFGVEPRSIAEFASSLDRALQDVNSDYQAKRAHGIFLDPLTVVKGRPGVFDDWLASTGKLGGQRKVPRLCNDRSVIDAVLKLNQE